MNVQASLGWLLLGVGAFGMIAGGGAYALTEANKAPASRTEIESAIRNYILAHPEIIPEAMERLQAQQTAKTIAANRQKIETPFAGAWAGAADGDVTLVMFTDYACGYCRASAPDIERLLGEDRKLKVVWRELPVLGPESAEAARVGLSAAKQGRYRDFHGRMFASGPLSDDKIATVQAASGLNGARVKADQDAQDVTNEIDGNLSLARTLRVSGTPTFVVGNNMLQGAVGYDALKKAIAEARQPRG